MTAFSLTRSEVWTLATLLHLPIQPDSVLCDWLALGDTPSETNLPTDDITSLREKGFYLPGNGDQPILPDLIRCLTLAAVNAAEIALVIQRGGRSTLTRFAQVGNGIVQYGMDDRGLTLFRVENLDVVADSLIPSWFVVSQDDHMQAEMPMDEFLLFKQACVLADLAAGTTFLESDTFTKKELMERFNPLAERTSLFSASEINPTPKSGEERVEEYFQNLIKLGFLKKKTKTTFEIGTAGRGLAAVFSDPDMCSLTISLQAQNTEFPITGVLLYGNGRLFLLESEGDTIILRQLSDYMNGSSWVKELLRKGSQARYSEYVIAPVN